MNSSLSSISSSISLINNYSSSFSIKEKQKIAIMKMLDLNIEQKEKENFHDIWKLFIYDSFCRDIISPLFKVGDLRKQGVTLHMQIEQSRQAVPDVPVVYFVMPTKENIKLIIEDLKNKLYDYYHLNFASHIPNYLLEELAVNSVQYNFYDKIVKIYDQYLSFISLENDLFSLNQKNSYILFNDSTLKDEEIEKKITDTAESLFSVLVTLGVIPIIRCPKNGAAEAVARELDKRLNDHLFENLGNNLLSENNTSSFSTFQRPVLVILDRNIDLTVMFHHTWTYQALVHDLLNMHLNRVQVQVQELDEKSSKIETKFYDLDSSDIFWNENANTPFPNIAVAVNTYLKEYKTALDDFNKISGGNVNIDHFDESQLLGKTKDLGSFVNTIPALREKKRIIDVHTNIATALLKQIKDRELDTYVSLEEGIITQIGQDKKEILSIISDPNRGTPEDKMRLFLMYFLSNQNISQTELEQFEEALKKVQVDLTPLKYLKKIKAFNQILLNSSVSASTSSSSSTVRGLFQKVNVESFGFGGGLTKQLGTLFTAGVKALLPTSKELYITRIVDCIMEMKNELGVENFLYFDPKIPKKLNSIPRKNTPFKEAIVFMIGGGNYVEYQNLQEYSKKQPMKKIIYGSTEIITAKQFLEQLKELSLKN